MSVKLTDPSCQRLYQERAALIKGIRYPNDKRVARLFQLIADAQYPVMDKLKCETLILHSHQAGGLGDVSQNFLCAQLIKKNRPQTDVRNVIDLHDAQKEKIEEIFPTKEFHTQFAKSGYYEAEQQFKEIMRSGYPLGVAQPLSSSGPFQANSHLRTVKEYGYSYHPDVKGNALAMGVDAIEEGILIPKMERRELTDIKTAWLKNALKIESPQDQAQYLAQRNLYNMYMATWSMQIAALYTVAAIEEGNQKPIDVFVPTKYSLKDLISWGVLNEKNLAAHGIGKLIRITPEGQETIVIGEGKEMRLLSGSLPKSDMEAVQQHSQEFFGCTGDCSFSEAVALNKCPFYDALGPKEIFLKSLAQLSKKQELKLLSDYLDALISQIGVEAEAFNENTPRGGFYLPPADYELSHEASVPRCALRKSGLGDKIYKFSEAIAKLYQNPNLAKEAAALNQHIQKYYNFESRLMMIVNRGLFLQNYPEVFAVEERLRESFEAYEIDEQDVVKTLSAAIAKTIGRNQEIIESKMEEVAD